MKKYLLLIAMCLTSSIAYAHPHPSAVLDHQSIDVPRLRAGHSRVSATSVWNESDSFGTVKDVFVKIEDGKLCVSSLIMYDRLNKSERIVYELNDDLDQAVIHIALPDEGGDRQSGSFFSTIPSDVAGRSVDSTEIVKVTVKTYRNTFPDYILKMIGKHPHRCSCRCCELHRHSH